MDFPQPRSRRLLFVGSSVVFLALGVSAITNDRFVVGIGSILGALILAAIALAPRLLSDALLQGAGGAVMLAGAIAFRLDGNWPAFAIFALLAVLPISVSVALLRLRHRQPRAE